MPWPWKTLLLAALASGVCAVLARGNALASSRPFDVVRVPRGDLVRRMALGQRGLVSDLYWLQTVQYVGEKNADRRGWGMLYPLVDLVTDLDPRHGYAYQTAGIVLSTVGRLDESDAILKKGIEKGPAWWTFPYYISFNYWFYRGDLGTAATWAERAARTPGASANISQLAVALRAKSGSPELAIPIIEELRASTKDQAVLVRLDEQLKLAILERDAQRLERAAAEFQRRHGRPILSLFELMAEGLVPEVPPDPFGGVYEWDHVAREVHSSVNRFRFRLREGPHAAQPVAPSPSP